jgi:hypothetical protein
VHGKQRSFLLSFPEDLGDVNIVSLYWKYDHDLDPLNLTKVCVLLCSDHVYVRSASVRTTHMQQTSTVSVNGTL